MRKIFSVLVLSIFFICQNPVSAEKYLADVYFQDGRQCISCKVKTDKQGHILKIWRGLIKKTFYYDSTLDSNVNFEIDRVTAEARKREKWQSIGRSLSQQSYYNRSLQNSQYNNNRPVQTTCYRSGIYVNCNSY